MALTAKQKKLPKALQQAILKNQKKKGMKNFKVLSLESEKLQGRNNVNNSV